jgi:hypothetical protein
MLRSNRTQRKPRKNDPWEVLVVAALFFLPGVALLFQRDPIIAFQQSFRWLPSGAIAMSPHGGHIFGLLAIGVALVIVWFYIRLRAQIRRDEDAGIRYPE